MILGVGESWTDVVAPTDVDQALIASKVEYKAPPELTAQQIDLAYANYKATVEAGRVPGPLLSKDAWIASHPPELNPTNRWAAVAATSLTSATPPGQRVGQRFSLRALPWWSWLLLGVIGWKLIWGRR